MLRGCYGREFFRSTLLGHLGSVRIAVALAVRLAYVTRRAIAKHYGVGSSAVAAIQRRMAGRPEVMAVVESLSRQLAKKRT